MVGWDLKRHRVRWVADIDGDNCSTVVVEPRTASALCGGRFSRVVSLDLDTGRQSPSGLDMQHGEISALLLTADGTLVQLSRTENLVARWRLDGLGPITQQRGQRGDPDGVQRRRQPAAHQRPGDANRRRLAAVAGADRDLGGLGRGGLAGRRRRPGNVDRVTRTGWSPGWRTAAGSVIDIRDGRVVRDLDGDLYGFPPDGTSLPPGGHHLLGWSEYDQGRVGLGRLGPAHR